MSDNEDNDEGASTPIPASSPQDGAVSTDGLTSTILSSVKENTTVSPSTPATASKKRKASATNGNQETANSSASKKAKITTNKRKRKSLKIPTENRVIARNYDESEAWDKMLIDWRDRGENWGKIRKEWERLTGDHTGTSTLPNRYNRLKTNFTVVKDVDKAVLVLAKQEVENAFVKEKWDIISQAMENHGTQKYDSKALERQYKKMMEGAEGLKMRLQVEANNKPKADDDDDDYVE